MSVRKLRSSSLADKTEIPEVPHPEIPKLPEVPHPAADKMDTTAFLLAFQEALRDPTILQSLATIVVSRIDDLADKVALKLDARLQSMDKQIKAKDQRIMALEKDVTELRDLVDAQEQYSRRESLRLFGIPETTGENTNALVMNFCTKMSLDPPLNPSEISRSHRAGEKKQGVNRPLLVKFTNYASRDRVIRSRKNLKQHNSDPACQTPLFVSEDLTRLRAHLAYKARLLKKAGKIRDTWTWDGKVYIQNRHRQVTIITREKELSRFSPPTAEGLAPEDPPPT